MLPETADGKDLFMRIRENRGRWRTWNLDRYKGDMNELKREELGQLELESDLAGFRECVEFMQSEDMLTPTQIEAANNVIGWADVLRKSLEVK